MILTIDIGNTRTKAGLFDNGKMLSFAYFTGPNTLGALRMALSKTWDKIEYIGIANVGNKYLVENPKVAKAFLGDLPILMINSKLKLPFEIEIEQAETLGADRIAAVAGGIAIAGNGPLLVITAGTAITLNYLDAQNKFVGGCISPGMAMRFKALHKFTAQLPLLEQEKGVPIVGNNTSTAISSGVINGTIAELGGMIENFREIAGSGLKTLLTGGDAEFLGNHLKNVNFADDYLQLKGIHLIVSQNRLHA